MAVGVMVKAPGKVVNKAGQRGAQAAQRIGESGARHDLRQRRLQAADQCLQVTQVAFPLACLLYTSRCV